MFRSPISKIALFVLILTLLVACTPTPPPATELPPTAEPSPLPPKEIPPMPPTEAAPTDIPPTPTPEAYPAPTENTNAYPPPVEDPQSAYPAPSDYVSLADLPAINSSNVAQTAVLASIPTYQDARMIWSADGTKFVAFHPFNSGEIRLYNLISGSFEPVILSGHVPSASAVAFSPDGTQLVSAGADSTLRVWDAVSGTPTAELDLTPYSQNSAYVDTLTFSPDGTKIALFMGVESTLYLFNFPLDATAPTPLAWTEHASPVVSVYPSPDWQTFAWVGRGTLMLMNADGTFRGEQISHEDFITNVLYTPDSQRLFIQTAQTISDVFSGVVIVYDTQTGQAIQTLVHPEFVTASTLSPDAKLLATSSANTVTVWDWATGTPVVSVPDLPDVAQKLTFSPDGTLLVGVFNTGLIQVWDVATGQGVASSQPGGELSGASFVLGGKVLAVTQFDGTVLLMGVAP